MHFNCTLPSNALPSARQQLFSVLVTKLNQGMSHT